MFPYTVNYTESESNIQNNNLLYKIDQQCQNTFEKWEYLGKNQKNIKGFEFFRKFRMYFGIVGLFCTINRYFAYRIRILCIFLYMGTYFKDMFRHFSTPKIEIVRPQKIEKSQKSEQFSYRGFLVLNGPLTSLKVQNGQ